MVASKSELMVLKTLTAMGPLHGYGIARRVEQISGPALEINQGTISASLVRLQQRGWISAVWGSSENNRRAKFWERISGVIGRVLRIADGANAHV
jgi:DNA-binding PadR family transcriptional regulator